MGNISQTKRERQKECEREEIHPNGLKNQANHYDADGEWNLAIRGREWGIENTMMEICNETAYECIRRWGTPKDGVDVGNGHCANGYLNYFDDRGKNFAP